MRIKYRRIVYFLVLLISSNFFGLYNVASKYTQIYFTDMIMLLLLGISVFSEIGIGLRDFRTIPIRRCVDSYALFFLFWTFLDILYTTFIYGSRQSLVDTLKASLYCIVPVLVYLILKHAVNSTAELDSFINLMIYISAICSLFAIFALFMLNFNGVNYLNLDIDNYSFMRNGRGHFMIGTMIVIPATIFLWVKVIKKELFRGKYLILIINFFHIIYIGQTRSLIAFLIISLMFSYVSVSKRSRNIKILIVVFALVFATVLWISEIVSSLNDLMDDNSVVFRLEAIDYYLSQIWSSPVFGTGFISASNPNLAEVLYGSNHRFYRTDVGIIGFANAVGLVGTIWYIQLLLYVYKYCLKNKNNKYYLYAFAYFVYISVSSLSLFCIDSFRVIYLSIFLLFARVLELNERMDENGPLFF